MKITMKVIKIAIIGATGGVGREIIRLLNSGFFYDELYEKSGKFTNIDSTNIDSNLEFEVTLVASDNSSGLSVKVLDKNVLIKGINQFMSEIEIESGDHNGDHYYIIFSCASSEISEKYVTKMLKTLKKLNNSSLIIDKTEYFRKKAPLVIPELNGHVVREDILNEISQEVRQNEICQSKVFQNEVFQNEVLQKESGQDESCHKLSQNAKLVSSPNCVAIPLIMLLYPVRDFIKRVVVSTYQSVSGAGINAVNSFYEQTQDLLPYLQDYSKNNHSGQEIFQKNLAFNAIPQIGSIDEDGLSSEERKIVEEAQLFLGKKIPISVTSVRVPTIVGHGMSVNIEFCNFSKKPYFDRFVRDVDDLNNTFPNVKEFLKFHLNKQKGVVVCDENDYMTTIESVNRNQVFVSRMRLDNSQKNTVSMWAVCDNMRKGAALNSMQIACEFLKSRMYNSNI